MDLKIKNRVLITLSELLQQNRGSIIEANNNDVKAYPEMDDSMKDRLKVDNIKIDGSKITANVIGNDEDVANLLKYLVLKDIPVLNYSRAVGNLEDVFIQITADSDEEEA